MHDSIISYDDLQMFFGGTSAADVVVRLKSQNIPYKTGKFGRPITTYSALNYSMGVPLNEVVQTDLCDTDLIEID